MTKNNNLMVVSSENIELKKLGISQAKKIGEFHFQLNFGTDSPGSRKPSADL